MGKNANQAEDTVFLTYNKFQNHVRMRLKKTSIPDYYYLLSQYYKKESTDFVKTCMHFMLERDYKGLEKYLTSKKMI